MGQRIVAAAFALCVCVVLWAPPPWRLALDPVSFAPTLRPVLPASPRPVARTIVAVGDLHGDLPNARRVLRFANVTDEHNNWSGAVDVFVQTGDIIDRGDDTIALFQWMDALRAQAAAAGGTVLTHLGNHEWMNAIGDWRYVYPSEIATFGSAAARQKYLSSGPLGRSWAANYTTASRLPLHPSLGPPNTPYPPPAHIEKDDGSAHTATALSHAALSFVHGGLAPHYPGLTPFPTRINDLGASLLRRLQRRAQPPPHPPAPYPGLPAGTTADEAALYGTDGPLWYRGWALDDEAAVCAAVDGVLQRTGTRRMVMGHTPDFDHIVSRCGGKILIIDTGISHAYGGALSALSVRYTLTPLDGAGADQRWAEKEVVSAVYEHRQEVLVAEEREIVGDFGSL